MIMTSWKNPVPKNSPSRGNPDKAPAENPFPLEKLFPQYAPRIFHMARRMLGNDADAEDVTQEIFLQVMRKLPTFRQEAAFSTWLYRVGINKALGFRRKRARLQEHLVYGPQPDFIEAPDRTPARRLVSEPLKIILDQEAHRQIEEAIACLPDIYQEIFVRAVVEEQPNAVIGRILGLSLAAVKSRLHRARLLLRKSLGPYFGEPAA